MDIEQIKADLKAIEKAPATSNEYWNACRRVERDSYEYAQDVIDLTAERDALAQRLRMVISHATGGNTTGEGLSINEVSYTITRLRNKIYDLGKANADKEITAERDRLLAANRDLVAQLAEPVKVKPLVWYELGDKWGTITSGRVQITQRGSAPFWDLSCASPEVDRDYETREAAQEAAQTAHAARIREALE